MNTLPPTAELMVARRTYQEWRDVSYTKDPKLAHWVGGLPATQKKIRNEIGMEVWESKPHPGLFWTPNAFVRPTDDVLNGEPWVRGDGELTGKKEVVALCSSFSEMDTGSLEDQLARLRTAVEAGLPVPSAIVWSGNKSWHVTWSYTETVGREWLEDWTHIQKALARVLGGDTALSTPQFRMRVGCNETDRQGPYWNLRAAVERDQRVAFVGERVPFGEMLTWAKRYLQTVPADPAKRGEDRPRTAVYDNSSEWLAIAADGKARQHRCPWTGTESHRCLAYDETRGQACCFCKVCKASNGGKPKVYRACRPTDPKLGAFLDEVVGTIEETPEVAPTTPQENEPFNLRPPEARAGFSDDGLSPESWASDRFYEAVDGHLGTVPVSVDPDSLDLWSDGTVEVADRIHVQDHGVEATEYITCSRAGYHNVVRRTSDGGSEHIMTRLACKAWDCPECGPLRLLAYQTAFKTQAWLWSHQLPGPTKALVMTVPLAETPAFQRMLVKHQTQNPRMFAWMAAFGSPDQKTYYLTWTADGRPADHSRLSDFLDEHPPNVGAPKEMVAELIAAINLEAWRQARLRGELEKIRLVGGQKKVIHWITQLAGMLLAEVKRKDPAVPATTDTTVAWRSSRAPTALMEYVGQLLRCDVVFQWDSPTGCGMRRTGRRRSPLDEVSIAKAMLADGRLTRAAAGHRRKATASVEEILAA